MWLLMGALAQTPFEAGNQVEARHMTVLAGWAGANLIGGTAGALVSRDPRWRAFHGTNAAWNTVNLAIAGAGIIGLRQRQRGPVPDAATWGRQHRNLRTALGVNLALDGVYMGTGLGFALGGGSLRGVDLKGMGLSLLVQGAFLAAFDAHFLLAHRRRTR